MALFNQILMLRFKVTAGYTDVTLKYMPPFKVVHNSAFFENLSIVLLNESLLKYAIPKVTFKDVTNDSANIERWSSI